MSLYQEIKKKLPATFNAAEYETTRILDSIDCFNNLFLEKYDRLVQRMQGMEAALAQLEPTPELLGEIVSTSKAELKQLRAEIEQVSVNFFNQSDQQLAQLRDDLRAMEQERQKEQLGQLETISKLIEEHTAKIQLSVSDERDTLRKAIENIDLYSLIRCKGDREFDEKMIPMNRFFNGHGMAVSMHLTSVAEKPDEICYQTADIVRTTTLSLIADEIKQKKLPGAAAELGVAQGNFAMVINALFPDKKLYLFDTFDGFQAVDIEFEKENGYSNAKRETYAGIDVKNVLARMRNPDNCIVRQGYFPDTAMGLEDEQYCFVSIDCDLYKPIYAGLEYFYPRLVKGGYIFVHDYRSKYYRGVREALRRFEDEMGISFCVIPDNAGSAIIVK